MTMASTSKSGMSRLLEEQEREINNINKKIQLYTKYQDDYRDLKKLIDTMKDKVKHPYRVPVAGSKLALLDGHIIHTNEITVLLGDNYFALRSAKQACQIIDRRTDNIKTMLNDCTAAKKKTEDWFKYSSEHKKEKEELVEIIETM